MKTNKMKKVMIAIDYDPTAQKVAESGFSLAKSMDAEVILLHIITDPVFYSTSGVSPILGFNGYMDMSPVQLENVEGLKEASIHYLERIKEHLGDKNISILVKEGNFAEAILSTAKEVRAEIIVIGTHSRGWLEEALIGSVTENVLRRTTIPLFIVPTKKSN